MPHTLDCPKCQNPFHLIPQLRGRQIQCNVCRGVFVVADDPWALSLPAARPTAGRTTANGLVRSEREAPHEGGAEDHACPQCASPLRLVPELHGWQIRCKTCRAVLEVSADPWVLSLVDKDQVPSSPAAGETEAVVGPAVTGLAPQEAAAAAPLEEGTGTPAASGLETKRAPQAARPSTTAARSRAVEDAAFAAIMGDDDTTGAVEDRPAVAREAKRPETAAPAAGQRAVSSEPKPKNLSQNPAPAPTPQAPQHGSAIGSQAKGEQREDAQESPAVKERPAREPARRHAQPAERKPRPLSLPTFSGLRLPDLGGLRWPKFRGLQLPAIGGLKLPKVSGSAVASAGAVLFLGFVLGWWLLSRGGLPEARYLPDDGGTFLSLRVREWLASDLGRKSEGTPAAELGHRCKTFLDNAGLKDGECQRVTAAETASLAKVAVYEMEHDVQDEPVANRPQFKSWDKDTLQKKDFVRGAPVYVIGPYALGFPGGKTVVTGDTAAVCAAMRNRAGKLSAPIRGLIQTLDFSKTMVAAQTGVPARLKTAYLAGQTDLVARVRGATRQIQCGPTIQWLQTLHLADAPSAQQLAQHLQQALANVQEDSRTADSVRPMLKAVRVSCESNRVHIELTWSPASLSTEVLQAVATLFE